MKKSILYYSFLLVLLLPGLGMDGQTEYYLKGVALLEQKAYREAVVLFEDALLEEGSQVRILLRKGEALFNLGAFQEAEASFLQANELEGGVANIWLARCRASQGQNEEAIQYLRDHLGSVYRLPEKTILSDPSFRTMERTREWRTLWKEEWYTPSDYQRVEAAYLISKDNYSDAISMLDILIAKKEDDSRLFYLRGQAYAGKGDLKQGLLDVDRAIEIDRSMPEYFMFRAGLFLKINQPFKAVSDLSRAIDLAPEKFELLMERARIYEQMKDLERALSDVERYLNFFNKDIEALSYASDLKMKSGRYFDALSDLNQGLKISPGEENLYLKRGTLYLETETYEYAEKDFSMALDLNPFNASTYFNRGLCRLELHKQNAACYDFQKAFDMGKKEALEYLQEHCDY